MSFKLIQAIELHQLWEKSEDIILIDVRERDEFVEVASPYAKNYPLSSLDVSEVLESLNLSLARPDTPLYFICRSGGRSSMAADAFDMAGYTNTYNVEGGMNRWLDLGLPMRNEKCE